LNLATNQEQSNEDEEENKPLMFSFGTKLESLNDKMVVQVNSSKWSSVSQSIHFKTNIIFYFYLVF
jgi:hypothetical protein